MTLALYALRGLARSPGRTAVRALVLGAAAGLLAAMVLFVGHSLGVMSASAVRSVPVDWQGPVPSAAAASRVAAGVARQRGVAYSLPVATGPFAGIAHRGPAGIVRAGAGAVLAVPPAYPTAFHTFRFLRGGFARDGIVLDQQLAATLQAQPGDTVLLAPRPGRPPVRLRVSGIALVTAADVLFQPLDPLAGPAAAQPPPNVAILPLDAFRRLLAPRLPVLSASNVAAAAVPGSSVGVQWQVQAQVDPGMLGGSPAHALRHATQARNAVERSLPGQVRFVDNLADALTTASGDALYAETLYIMLAVPGALIGLGLAYFAALGTIERDRRDLTLLRARGATRRHVLLLALAESAVLGLAAGALGTAAAALAIHGTVASGTLGTGRLLAAFGVSVAVAFAGAAAARLGAAADVLGSAVGSTRRSKPLWERLYLDVVALVVCGLVYWLTLRTGFSAVVNPDSNPTLSLSVYMFFAPALLWIGATLLLVRLRGRLFGWAAFRLTRGRGDSLAGFLLASVSRRGTAVNRGLVLLGLLLAFGVDLAVFTATYDQQARVDAQLTLGADVVATGAPGTLSLARLAAVRGVRGAALVDHSYAYVGPDLQDIFGIEPSTLRRGTGLRDSYFLGGSAATMLARLRARSDAVLVSRETIGDYSLGLGDLLRLRVLDRRTGRFRVAPFHVAGIVQEFPSAPRDSFMVANLSYLHSVTQDAGPNVAFVRAAGDPAVVAGRVASALPGASVRDIRRQAVQTVSSITTVDLGGIGTIERAFAVVLGCAAVILAVFLALSERRQELATMVALGASTRRTAAFVWSETALVLAAALALAALLGWLLAEMLVAMLRHVFDPPPDHLAAPWSYLALLGGAVVAAAVLAALGALLAVRRLPVAAILREE